MQVSIFMLIHLRGDLRELELGSLKPGTVKWGHGLRSCVALDNDTYELTFLDETIDPVKTSILIGADGSFSRVRMILHDIKPTYSGVTMYDLSVPVERMTPELRSFVGSGSCFILNEGSAILPQMNSGGRCKVYAAVQRPAEWIDAHPLPEEGKRKWIAGMYAGWCDALAEKLIMAADEETVVARRIYGFQPGLKWDSDLSGATVIGKQSRLHLKRSY
jgi:2-polyprenyl-6-methoxyphenol hydroxylase-like FAD-dependent oxidoreductase